MPYIENRLCGDTLLKNQDFNIDIMAGTNRSGRDIGFGTICRLLFCGDVLPVALRTPESSNEIHTKLNGFIPFQTSRSFFIAK